MFITEKGKMDFYPFYFLGLLNSNLVFLWLYKKGRRKGESLELYPGPLGEIPIANATSEQKEQIETLVKQVIEAAKNEDDEKVAQLESEINTCVNELYGLSDEEVAALEKFVGKH